jgi:hypothetical protein
VKPSFEAQQARVQEFYVLNKSLHLCTGSKSLYIYSRAVVYGALLGVISWGSSKGYREFVS